jgi:hypothetical protein
MTSFYREEDLAAMLAELRPAPRPEFIAELDARAAAGFPRREADAASPLREVLARLRATPPRKLLVPAGAVAVAAIVASTAVIAVSERGSGDVHRRITEVPAKSSGVAHGGAAFQESAGTSLSSGSGEVQSSEASGSAEVQRSAAPVRGESAAESVPYASHHGRAVERGASMTLAAHPTEVRSDAAQVFEAVHAADGIVLHSAIHDGSAGHAGASFDLLIPTAKLGDAMAAFSGIAEVRDRHESSADITAPTVSARENLQDSSARIKSLLAQLASADTEAERAQAEYELNAARGRKAALRSQLAALQRRANLAHVSLRIETGGAADEGDGAGWGVGDGFDDAGRILAIAAGVAIVGLAALAPFAILALLGGLARGAYVRRARAHALG